MPDRETLYDHAIGAQQQGDLEGAIQQLLRLIQQEPDYALAHAALSVFFGKLRRYEEAVSHAQRVCELEPEDPFSFIALSLVCQQAGQIAEAERALMQARQAQALARQQSAEG